jgi:N-acetylglucosamine-6-phosphate deacetylase
MRIALIDGRVLSDDGFVDDRTVLIRDGRVEALVAPDDPRCKEAEQHSLGGLHLLPGFVDVQVNGGGGALFNDDPSVATIATIASAHRRYGTTSLLPTLISDDTRVIARAIEATRDAIAQGIPGIVGVHIEGPCLNEVKKGAHDAAKFRDLDDADIELLSSLRDGRMLVTLAPEMTSPATIAKLVRNGVIVSAGHTNATYAQMQPALRAGVTGFTHLFNAMSPLTSREPGVVGAALADRESWCGLIVDGHHVDPVVMRIALASRRQDRFMLVTDAMPGVGSNQDHFHLQGRRIEVRDGSCYDDRGVLTGSNLDMASAVRNAMSMLGVTLEQAARMASTSPAEFLGLGKNIGRIAPGYRADLVLVDQSLGVRALWMGGRSASPLHDPRQNFH